MSNIDCPICGASAHETLPRSGDFHEITCLNCGHFRITKTAAAEVEQRSGEERQSLLSEAQGRASGEALPIIGAS